MTKTPREEAKSAPAAQPATRPARASRADFGKPVDAFFAKQPVTLAPIALALRALVQEVAPDATGILKWGMPFYQVAGRDLCGIGGHKAHVNLILCGPRTLFADPDGLLAGEGESGAHLRLTKLTELPTARARRWLRAAADHARANAREGAAKKRPARKAT